MAEDLLRLPSIKAFKVDECDDSTYLIHATAAPIAGLACPQCGSWRLQGHGTHEQHYVDVPSHGRWVVIVLHRRRLRCAACGKTIFEPVTDLDSRRLATARLVEYVRARCMRKTFADLSREVGLDDQTIRNIFDDMVADLKASTRFVTPTWLGIDEIKVVGQYRAVITNVEKNTLFDILPDRNKATLLAYFRELPDRSNVKLIAMDMWSVYSQVAAKCFPGIPVIVDRFHVERMASEALEKVRKAVRKSVSTRQRLKLKDDRHLLLARFERLSPDKQVVCQQWFEAFPLLGQAHGAKEAFARIYECASRPAAEHAFERWRDGLAPEMQPYFRDLVLAVTNRRQDIFNYFEHRITNAYTESINNLIKLENRMGRGYSFEVLRARMLYDQKARKVGSTSVRRAVRKDGKSSQPIGLFSTARRPAPSVEFVDQIIEYGPHIPTLVKLLEEGRFE